MKKSNEKQLIAEENVKYDTRLEENYLQYITRKRFVMQFQDDYVPDKGSENTMPSETVPGQAKSITEILTRFANGMPLGIDDIEGQFFEDNLVTDVRKLDLTQRQELAIAAQQKAAKIRRELELADVERKKQKYLADMEKAFKEKLDKENIKIEANAKEATPSKE